MVRLHFQEKTIIVKHVQLPSSLDHPRGWNTNLSHQRKVHSYQVEVKWYEEFSKVVDKRCRIPQGLKCFQKEDEWLIVMEDLSSIGLEYTTFEANENHLKSCLSWLANFHAKYMGKRIDSLWEIGTYWHLDTRPDELEALHDLELKNSAKQIDAILNNTTYQTIVHGDAKLANFCFNKLGIKCAAVDFQYVGHGCGMKDVAYFMSSAIEPEDCEKMEEWILDTYFKELRSALKYYQPDLDSREIEKEWRAMFVIAWADFQRFIKGWSPKHFKINSYTDELTSRALESLKANMILSRVEKEEYKELLEVWENSVRATHYFLKEEDLQELKPLILNQYFDAVELFCVKDESGKILGFSGVLDGNLEMLFIDDRAIGQGLGKLLVQYTISNKKVNKVDVNEQNQEALGFYKHMGFTVVGRSELDGQGKPYPLLHLELGGK